MNKTKWQKTKQMFSNSLLKMVDMKYITVSKLISIDGLASGLTSDLSEFEQKEIKQEEVSEMFDIMQRYFPKMFEKLIKEGINPNQD